MLSSLLMHCYKQKGWGSTILSPLSGTLIHFLGKLYVDNTDLIMFQPIYYHASDLWDDLQSSVMDWGNLLLATGKALNPSKCSWYLVDYEFTNGEWQYKESSDWELYIPIPDGGTAPIPLLPPGEASKMLSIWSCPTGDDDKHIETDIVGKYQKWLFRSKTGTSLRI